MVNFNLCEFHLSFLVKKNTGINLFMSSSQKPYKFGTNAIYSHEKTEARVGKGPGQGHTDIRLEARVWLTPKPWLRVGCGPWENWEMRGIGGGSKGEKHCPEAGSKQKGFGVTLVSQHQQNQQNLNLSAPANSVLCSDCAPQLLCVPLNSLHQRTVTNHLSLSSSFKCLKSLTQRQSTWVTWISTYFERRASFREFHLRRFE